IGLSFTKSEIRAGALRRPLCRTPQFPTRPLLPWIKSPTAPNTACEPLPAEYPTLAAAIHGQEADNLMAELGEDKEVQELLLRKIRERGLAGKLLMKVS
ncbi:MAG: hypothetical protein ABSF14_24135, partial [Terriglobia bacterium]